MTDAKRLLIVRARTPLEFEESRTPAVIGVVRRHPDGWRFLPMVSGRRPSRRSFPTWEKALPRWTGGLDSTESRRMDDGETIPQVMEKFRAVFQQEVPATYATTRG